jgi:outer membrane protein OmpA-like peptidoglycan-associated protein/flagellar hook assembly protein FlgD
MKKMKMALMFALLLWGIYGCATFEGSIPLESEGKDLYLSPKNNDGIMDTISVPMNIPETRGLKIQGYSIEIRSALDDVVYSKTFKDEPGGIFKRKHPAIVPGEILWDGKTSDGKWAADGAYSLTVNVNDYKGNTGFLGPVRIIVDNTAPYAQLYFPYSIFSPNGDGSQDSLDIHQQEASAEALWIGTIKDSNNELVRTFRWSGVPALFSWNGKTENDELSPEGSYSYTLESTDEGGNSFRLGYDQIVIDNTAYPVQMRLLSADQFSPNDDGVMDTVRIEVEAAERSRINSLKLKIINAAGDLVKELKEESPGIYVFDGKKSGKTLPEGYYYAGLEVQYNNGALQKAVSGKLKLDLTAPTAVLKVSLPVFSPNNDGRKDSVEIFQSSSVETVWTGQIMADKRVIRSWKWNERVVPVLWDGLDASGLLVADGLYQYRLNATDAAGNSAVFLSSLFSVDTKATPVQLTQSINVFSPNSDGHSDVVMFYPRPLVKEGIASWIFTVLDESEARVFKVSGMNSLIPETISWDGRNTGGTISEGLFRGELEVEYLKGNYEKRGAVPAVRIDLTEPDINLSTSNLPFSPDGDGESDILTIQIDPQDPSGIESWSARILDPAGSLFFTLNPMNFINGSYFWNGKDKRGELVQSASDYILEVEAVDGVGNRNSVKKTIPIDILVLKDGDKLRISISSIYFKPFTADYLSIDPELKSRNLKTLDRLAEILMKYGQYNIQLEGHAVRLLWKDEKKWMSEEEDVLLPLSRERAETIKSALVQRGIQAARMSSMGYGGYKPVVPHSDEQNRWKNRRVEFILIK